MIQEAQMSLIQLFHGSDHIVEMPDINAGNPRNDYGQGLYCTRDEKMACEWACRKNADGFVNIYDFDDEDLQILNLLDGHYSILNWIALLLRFRTFRLDTEIAIEARDYIIGNYSIDVSGYDVIVGYRADDSYFQYAEAFVSNGLSLRGLNRALHLGKLGEQTAIISEKGLEHLTFAGAFSADKNIYYPKFLDRDANARDTYRREIKKGASYHDDIYVLDILREEIADNDPRIQRIVSE